MKQTLRRLAALLCILCFFTLYGAAEDKPTAQELVAQWAETRYPDDVGNIYTDQGKLVIGLVDGSEARQEELRAMVSDPGSLAFDEAAYPYNDLLAVKEEISRELSSDEGLYSVGVGWTSAEGTGFGPSGKDSRVVVSAEAGKLAYYQTLYEERYGGMVVVVEGEPIFAVAGLGTSPWIEQGWAAALLLLLAAGGALLLLACLRTVRARRRADGGTDAPHGPISRRAAEQAVRESAASPPEQVLERLLERMRNRPSHFS